MLWRNTSYGEGKGTVLSGVVWGNSRDVQMLATLLPEEQHPGKVVAGAKVLRHEPACDA